MIKSNDKDTWNTYGQVHIFFRSLLVIITSITTPNRQMVVNWSLTFQLCFDKYTPKTRQYEYNLTMFTNSSSKQQNKITQQSGTVCTFGSVHLSQIQSIPFQEYLCEVWVFAL